MGCYLAIEKNEITMHTTTWVNHRKYNVKLMKPVGSGREILGITTNKYEVSVWGDENLLEIVVVVAQYCKLIKTTEVYNFKWWILWYVNYVSINCNYKKSQHNSN